MERSMNSQCPGRVQRGQRQSWGLGITAQLGPVIIVSSQNLGEKGQWGKASRGGALWQSRHPCSQNSEAWFSTASDEQHS